MVFVKYLLVSLLISVSVLLSAQHHHADTEPTLSNKELQEKREALATHLAEEKWDTVLADAKTIHGVFFRKMNFDSINHYYKLIDSVALKVGELNDHLNARVARLYNMQMQGDKIIDYPSEIDYIKQFIDSSAVDVLLRSEAAYLVSCFEADISRYDQSTESLKKAITLADQQTKKDYLPLHFRIELSRHLNNIGKYNGAIEYLLQAEKIAKATDAGPMRSIQIDQSFGIIFKNIGDYKKSKYYFNKALDTAKEKKYQRFISASWMRLGAINVIQGEYELGRVQLEKALSYLRKKKLTRALGNTYAYLSQSYVDEGNLTLAKSYIDSASVIFKKSENILDLDEYYYHNARYLVKSKQYNRANAVIEEALKNKITFHRENGDYDKLKYEIAKSQGNNRKALQHYEDHAAKRDSTSSVNQLVRVQRLESEFNRKQQETKIEALNTTTKAQQRALSIRNIALIAGSIMLLILAGLLLGLYRLFLKYRANQAELAKQNIVITEALKENQILIKEIHHRVKNNLQVISSLLSMQARKVTDEGTKDALNSSKTRVQSMSILHQNLYQNSDLTGVDVDEYIAKLVDNIFDTYNLSKNIDFDIDIDKVRMDVDTLVPIGLIANELICNALKYAFVGRESGHLKVSLKEKGEKVILTVMDDGVGFEGDSLPLKEGSLGVRLINSFTQRLDGVIKLDKSNGTAISIEFDKKKIDRMNQEKN